MKDTQTKRDFIKARAEGKSYSTITKELGIAKATCASWERSLKEDIDALRQAQLEELYTAYNMTREARIKALGDTLQRIDSALAEKDLEDLPADKLLYLRLKYGEALKEEYTEPVELDTDNTLDSLLEQFNQIYMDSKGKKYSPTEIKAQLSILEAKWEILYQLADEHKREEKDPLACFDFDSRYYSRVLRHND